MSLRLVFVSPSFYPATVYGGPMYASHALCKNLAALGVEVRVVTTDANGREPLDVPKNTCLETAPGLFITYYREQIHNILSFKLLFHLSSHIGKGDVIHMQSVFSTYTALSLFWSARYGKPLVLSPRGSLGSLPLERGSRWKKTFLRLFIRPFADSILFHAASQKEADEIKLLYPEATCAVLPNGVEVPAGESTLADRRAYLKKFTGKDFNEPPVIVVSLSRLHAIKRLDVLIRAVDRIRRERNRRVVLLLAGPDEGERENLSALAESLGMKDEVFFPGPLQDAGKWQFLSGADVLALPSEHENFGNVVPEALACGTPVAASRHTPWAELESQRCGRWVDNTPEAFAEAIASLLDEKSAAFSERAQAFAGRYAWSGISEAFLKTYENLRAKNR